MHRQGYSNRAAARSAVRNATVRRSLARGRVPDGAPEKAATIFVAPFPSGRTRTSRKRSCSSRGDWSLKMVAGLWAGATIERERKRGANNVRRALRTTARAVLRSKMEALQADKRTGLNS